MRPLKGSGLSADYPVRIPGAAPRSGPERSDRPLMFLEGTVINHRGQADVAHNKLPGPALNPGLRRRFFDLRLRLSDGSVDEFSFTGPHDLRVVRGDTVRVDGLVLTNLTSGDRWPVRDVGHGRPVRRPLQRPSVLAGPVSTYRWKTGLPVAAAVTGLAAVYGIGVGAADRQLQLPGAGPPVRPDAHRGRRRVRVRGRRGHRPVRHRAHVARRRRARLAGRSLARPVPELKPRRTPDPGPRTPDGARSGRTPISRASWANSSCLVDAGQPRSTSGSGSPRGRCTRGADPGRIGAAAVVGQFVLAELVVAKPQQSVASRARGVPSVFASSRCRTAE